MWLWEVRPRKCLNTELINKIISKYSDGILLGLNWTYIYRFLINNSWFVCTVDGDGTKITFVSYSMDNFVSLPFDNTSFFLISTNDTNGFPNYKHIDNLPEISFFSGCQIDFRDLFWFSMQIQLFNTIIVCLILCTCFHYSDKQTNFQLKLHLSVNKRYWQLDNASAFLSTATIVFTSFLSFFFLFLFCSIEFCNIK